MTDVKLGMLLAMVCALVVGWRSLPVAESRPVIEKVEAAPDPTLPRKDQSGLSTIIPDGYPTAEGGRNSEAPKPLADGDGESQNNKEGATTSETKDKEKKADDNIGDAPVLPIEGEASTTKSNESTAEDAPGFVLPLPGVADAKSDPSAKSKRDEPVAVTRGEKQGTRSSDPDRSKDGPASFRSASPAAGKSSGSASHESDRPLPVIAPRLGGSSNASRSYNGSIENGNVLTYDRATKKSGAVEGQPRESAGSTTGKPAHPYFQRFLDRKEYFVRDGETLGDIADRLYQDRSMVDRLRQLNNLGASAPLKPGQKIRLP